MTLFDRIGADTLRLVLEDFYQRVFADPMIGFMFARANKHRIVAKEAELVARMLGDPGRYSGLPMREAHAAHKIFGGHFARRQKILAEVLAAHAIDPEVRRVWLEHNEALRPQITSDDPSECND